MRLKKAARVILVGAPGAGKGTQSERLLQRFPQLSSISTGDLLRSNVKRRTPLGIKAENTMKSGGLVADELVLRLISNELSTRGWLGPPNTLTLNSSSTSTTSSSPAEDDSFTAATFLGASDTVAPTPSNDPSASFLLDGYPRNAHQALSLERLIPINLAVNIITPFSIILSRITNRWIHEPSGRVYNTTFNAPRVEGIDDVTGERLTKRADDTEEVYRARYDRFRKDADPLLEHYAKRGVLMEVEGETSDEISPKLYEAFEKMFVH